MEREFIEKKKLKQQLEEVKSTRDSATFENQII